MMAAIFAAMLLALLLSRLNLPKLAVLCLGAALALSVYLFQWEIYSPETGFRMPWLQTERAAPDAPMAG